MPLVEMSCTRRVLCSVGVTQTLAFVDGDGIPPVAGRPGRPRRRLEELLDGNG